MAPRHGHGTSDRHDAMARMHDRRGKAHSACSMGESEGGDAVRQQVPGFYSKQRPSRGGDVEYHNEPSMLPPPTPRGGGRGPAAARLARTTEDIDTADDPLPPDVKGADFKTLQALIAKGIQNSEEDGVLLETSLGGGEWGIVEDAEEVEWRQKQQRKREAEEATREKERELAREQRRRQEEQRRRQQMEELEREMLEEKRQEMRLVEEQEQQAKACCREPYAATQIQALYRGRQSRARQKQ